MHSEREAKASRKSGYGILPPRLGLMLAAPSKRDHFSPLSRSLYLFFFPVYVRDGACKPSLHSGSLSLSLALFVDGQMRFILPQTDHYHFFLTRQVFLMARSIDLCIEKHVRFWYDPNTTIDVKPKLRFLVGLK